MIFRKLLGNTVELTSAKALGTSNVFAKIDRILELIDDAKYNKDALPYVKAYLTEVKNAMNDRRQTINEEQAQTLMKALRRWEKFLLQYTKPKMKVLLQRLSTTDRISKKIENLFENLDAAIKFADIEINLQTLTERVERRMTDPVDSQDTIIEVVQQQVKNAIVTTAYFHGAPLSESEIEKLNIDSESVTRDPDVSYDSVDNSCTKVIYRDVNQHHVRAAKIRIGRSEDSDIKERLSRHYVQVYISTYLNVSTDLFMKHYGILLDGTDYYMITEWSDFGTLDKFLEEHKDICWDAKIEMASRLANAVAICHSKLILHHDIRCHNVFVDKTRNVKLGNFALSRTTEDVTTTLPEFDSSNVRWRCPEKVKNSRLAYTMKADIYSFGMLMWEISSHQVPFAEKDDEEVYMLLKNSDASGDDSRPRIIEGTPKKYQEIMQACWDQDPDRRPSMELVSQNLDSLEKEYKNSNLRTDSSDSIEQSIQCDPSVLARPNITMQTARELHAQRRYDEAFAQFEILADAAEPNAEANYYVGLYLMNTDIDFSPKDTDKGISYLETASKLGCTDALQYRAQEKIAAAIEYRKRFLAAGQIEDADAITLRMKYECLPLFLKGAKLGNYRCMKDLADYGAKLNDENSYRTGVEMLENSLVNLTDNEEREKVQQYLKKLQQHRDKFDNH